MLVGAGWCWSQAVIGSLGGVTAEINFRSVMRNRLTLAGSTLRCHPVPAVPAARTPAC
jgi:hypothetical protein